jgi:hypothetical protein
VAPHTLCACKGKVILRKVKSKGLHSSSDWLGSVIRSLKEKDPGGGLSLLDRHVNLHIL